MSRDPLWQWFPYIWTDGSLSWPDWTFYGEPPLHQPAYYLFIEDASPVDEFGEIDGPGDAPLGDLAKVFERPQTRFRTSGVPAAAFIETMAEFGILGRDAPRERRENRRRQLTGFFEKYPVERFDIYVDEKDEEGPAINATLVPTSWHLVLLSDKRPATGERRVYGALTAAAVEGYQTFWLASILPITPPIEIRLRDVFSLYHIGDADLGPAEGGGEPGGPPDDDGPTTEQRWTLREADIARSRDWDVA